MRIDLGSIGAAVFLSVVMVASAPSAHGQTRYNADLTASSVKVDGTSTLHDWEMEGKMVGGNIEFGPDVKLDPATTTISGLSGGNVPVKVRAIIPVESLKSKADHSPEIMDHLMEEHLKAADYPRIEYHLKTMTPKGAHEAGKPFEFDTTGDLAIAGKTNAVSFPVVIEVLNPAKIHVTATVPLKMTDYGIDPPAPNIGLGLMKCGDDIKIILDWTLKARKKE
jgi:polyisoprenoid-binding protein YceI